MKPQQWMNVASAAELLDCSEKTVLRLLRTSQLKGHRLGVGRGRGWRIAESDLAKFQESRRYAA
jgi:excisionase family DNA binding protein